MGRATIVVVAVLEKADMAHEPAQSLQDQLAHRFGDAPPCHEPSGDNDTLAYLAARRTHRNDCSTPESRPSSGTVRILSLEVRFAPDSRRRWARAAKTGHDPGCVKTSENRSKCDFSPFVEFSVSMKSIT